jgi:hypothetical protein
MQSSDVRQNWGELSTGITYKASVPSSGSQRFSELERSPTKLLLNLTRLEPNTGTVTPATVRSAQNPSMNFTGSARDSPSTSA